MYLPYWVLYKYNYTGGALYVWRTYKKIKKEA